MTLYNEIEPYAAQWLENLIAAGHIEHGRVDRRSIQELKPEDCGERAHFFAGIGVWAYALRKAGWPDSAPVWTGSCPCQPFSSAGAGRGVEDERHLWPEWFRLIRECRPPVIFGEQVANGDGLQWLDAVCADLEGAGYAVGAADLSAAGVGAPHIRQRLYFVAYAPGGRRPQVARRPGVESKRREIEPDRLGNAGGLADAPGLGRRQGGLHRAGDRASGRDGTGTGFGDARPTRDVGDTAGARREGLSAPRAAGPGHEGAAVERAGATRGFWADADWLPCVDGVSRPVEPGTFPLAHGAPARVGRLRAYGNSLCAPAAVTFVQAAMEALDATSEP